MTDQQDGTQPVAGWRPPEPASEATFVPPPPAPAPAWPPPPLTDTSVAPSWPPPPAGWPGAAAAPPRSTSIFVVLSAIFLILTGLLLLGMGSLLLLGSALFVGAEGGAEFEELVGGDLAGALAGIFAVVGAVAFGASLLQIVGAFGMLAHRGWGRAIGLVVGVLGLLFWGLSFVGALGAPADAGSSLGFTGVLVAGYGLTVVALAGGAAHFRRG